MTSPQLDRRLRRAMGDRSPALDPMDDVVGQAWDDVRNRIRSEDAATGGGRRDDGAAVSVGRSRLPVAAAAATTLLLGGLVAWFTTRHRSEVSDGIDAAGPAEAPALPTAPSTWWVLAAAALAVVAITVIHRRFRQPLVTVGLTLMAAGMVAGAALMLPSIRAGESLAADAPELPGHDLVSADLDHWPDRHTRAATTLRYRERNPSVEAGGFDTAQLASTAERLGLTQPLPSRSGYSRSDYCRQRPGVPEGDFLRGEMYCLTSVDDGVLTVTGHLSILGNRLLLPRLVAYGLAGFGLIFLLVAGAGEWLGEGPFWRGLGPLAGALCIFAVAGYVVGLIAYDLIRVRLAVDVPPECRPGAGMGIVECREVLYPALDAQGALPSGLRIYWPIYVIADLAAGFLLLVGWMAAMVAGENRRRWLLFVGLTVAIVVVGVASQLGSADLIDTMSNLND